jgi:hypothetical protein
MAVDDQPVDGGQRALELILVRELESPRHARLPKRRDLPS